MTQAINSGGTSGKLTHDALKPEDAFGKSVFVSLLLGSVPAMVLQYPNHTFLNNTFGNGLVVGALAISSVTVWANGWQPVIPIGWIGVRTFLDNPRSEFVGSGTYWAIPILEKYWPVNVQEHMVVEEKFMELAADQTEVYLTGYFMSEVVDPHLMFRVPNPDAMLMNLFKDATRSFVSQWATSMYLTNQKGLLNQFLELELDSTHMSREHQDYRAVLMTLTREGGKKEPYLTKDGVDTIMDAAGKFRTDAKGWGIYSKEAAITKVDIDEGIKKSRDAVRVAKAEMEVNDIQHAQRMKMANEMRASDETKRMTMSDAINFADRLMGLGVTTKLSEFKLHDADLIVEGLKDIVTAPSIEIFLEWIKEWIKNRDTK